MILELEANVFGNFRVEDDFNLKIHPYTFSIKRIGNETIITLSRVIQEYDSFIPRINFNPTINKLDEIIFPNEDFLNEEIKILQHIESFGALDMNISKISWNKLKIRWIPETDDERKKLPIREYKRNIEYISSEKVLSKKWLLPTLVYRRQLGDLYQGLSFYREGVNFYHNFQYQNAFLNFFIMIEGFFGNGKHTQDGLEKEFKDSKILEFALSTTLSYLETNQKRHYEWLIDETKKYNKELDNLLVIRHLIRERGNLSHFSVKTMKRQRNPNNDKHHESLAFIAMTICMYATIKLRLEPFRSTNN